MLTGCGNIRPLQLKNKEVFLHDLENLEYSWVGRGDCFAVGSTFIQEAKQLLCNSIALFEQGFFDCAFYSLRSAIEISTTIVYLVDMPEEARDENLVKWKEKRKFPMQAKMLELLSKHGEAFADMRKKMDFFFDDTKNLSAAINKYVHKQGFEHFYVSRNHPMERNKPQDGFVEQFEHYFKRTLGVVAVMRLAIDPFPILLMDPQVSKRCFESLTEPYQDEFVAEYVGEATISAYKTTTMYQELYSFFMEKEEKSEVVFDISHNQHIDSQKKDEIMKQIHLLDKMDAISAFIVFSSEKVINVYTFLGLNHYFTDRTPNRLRISFNSSDFQEYEKAVCKFNQKYDEAYISVFTFDEMTFWVEHNEQLSEDDIHRIKGNVNSEIAKYDVLFKV